MAFPRRWSQRWSMEFYHISNLRVMHLNSENWRNILHNFQITLMLELFHRLQRDSLLPISYNLLPYSEVDRIRNHNPNAIVYLPIETKPFISFCHFKCNWNYFTERKSFWSWTHLILWNAQVASFHLWPGYKKEKLFWLPHSCIGMGYHFTYPLIQKSLFYYFIE